MLVSICTTTLDRYDLAVKCLGPSLSRAGTNFELLSCDNGSQDRRVIDYVGSLKPAYHRLNPTNEGYSKAFNQMFLRAQGDYICQLDPDILQMNEGWLAALVDCAQAIPDTGISGIHCVMELWPAKVINGKKVHPGWHTFGTKFFHRTLFEKIGYLCEDFGRYGMEDVDVNYRVNKLGLRNYYVGGYTSEHCGNDVGHKTAYREQKWKDLEAANLVFQQRVKVYEETQNYFVPPPELR